ncbi:MAG TPA: LLM class flavin-dependent oxidoreductase [Xanthobacteraceae bacterium]|jgi:alkanesulfonate monooxygenase SsuD/methylene tetrahydromethanopterin reductase-like flavin-dependent oxidoreductase (luciferase family)|nr:LLM class flavin-dependent oxidoreductase [Xanthobacteraceae bacterium]
MLTTMAPSGAAAATQNTAGRARRLAMYNDNALKIGLFGANCSSGRSATTVPERWSASWPECLALARLADAAGIDFMLPIARWKGYGGDTDFHGRTHETITWAVGLLGATKRMTVFGTVHAPLFHPLIAAKEFVTADHIGQGRVGVNIVCGWNEGEFDMFGVTLREHDARYDYAQEWVDIVKQAWDCEDTFDYQGEFLKLNRIRAFPKPFGGTQPLMMNAGSSDAGQAFALRNCDAFFVATSGSRKSLAGTATKVTEVKTAAQALGRQIEVFTVGQVICRPTQKEAEDYYQHVNIDNADWGAIDGMLANKSITPQTIPPDEYYKKRHYFAATAVGGYPFVGTPDRVAEELANISQAGVRGIGLSFVNYLKEVPYFCDEVLPRLERAGVRTKT